MEGCAGKGQKRIAALNLRAGVQPIATLDCYEYLNTNRYRRLQYDG